MTSPSKRQLFLLGEGDTWFQRNRKTGAKDVAQWTENDQLVNVFANLPRPRGPEVSVLEVGCGHGLRLKSIQPNFGWSVAGVDPSALAVRSVTSAGLLGTVSTADALPAADSMIDLLIFGFCLCLCDRADLFKIAAEADRVMKLKSWLSILDFWSPHEKVNAYHHLDRVVNYESNLPGMFAWYPSYVATKHHVRHQNATTRIMLMSGWPQRS
ncbi:MAG: hypothetical protein CMN98_04260 [Synechococcus sp. NP17]|nr:hypothetical protein [Synechococcus sp. NP17]|tara:strand:+ start:1103 stop:1738 length:636 start_codon:yes stop_codon:yes gene_type:complete